MIETTVVRAHLKKDKTTNRKVKELEQALETIRHWCRKQGVECIEAKLTFEDILVMPIEVYDRGKRMQVDVSDTKRKTYGFNTDGVCLALGDLIRERYQGKPTYLDIYQRLLGL